MRTNRVTARRDTDPTVSASVSSWLMTAAAAAVVSDLLSGLPPYNGLTLLAVVLAVAALAVRVSTGGRR